MKGSACSFIHKIIAYHLGTRELVSYCDKMTGVFLYLKSETGAAETRTAANLKTTKGKRNVQNEMAKTELSS